MNGKVKMDEHESEQDVRRSSRIQINIGLDFGTSFTKVIVGDSLVRYVVPFDDFEGVIDRFLLPSALNVTDPEEECVLGTKTECGRIFDDLKVPLMERDFNEDVQLRIAAYVALVLRHTREWLLNVHHDIYGNSVIEWFINIGLPTENVDDDELNDVYKSLVRDAWHLSILDGGITMNSCFDFTTLPEDGEGGQKELLSDRFIPNDRVNVVPEFVAHLATYISTRQQESGLCVTIDVGGGTMDVSIFNVLEDNEEERYRVFSRKVKRLGVRYLIESRKEKLGNVDEIMSSPFDNLPSDDRFCTYFNIESEELNEIDLPFVEDIADLVRSQLTYTREYRYPTAPQWHDASFDTYGDRIPAFLYGGGALSDFYGDLLRRFERREIPIPFRLRFAQAQTPPDVRPANLPAGIFARLSVAYGLSIDYLNISRIRRKADIDDAHLPPSDPDRRYIYRGPEQM